MCTSKKTFERGRDPKDGLGLGPKNKYCKWLERNGIINRYDKNLKGSMQVIHIDSECKMTIEQIQFIKCVISNVKEDLLAMGFYYLLNHIPIFVVDVELMKKLNPNDHKSIIPPVEYLGWYQRVSMAKIPTIYICLDRIISLVDKKWGEFTQLGIESEVLKTYIIANVVIHEFAHALMDNPAFDLSDLDSDQRERFDWIEEPLANAFALHIAKEFKNEPKFFESVKLCIEKEPPNYKMGVDFYKKNVLSDWRNWAEKKDMKNHYPPANSNTSMIKDFLK